MKEITLHSGRELKINLAPFAVSKALYQAFLEEAKDVRMDGGIEVDIDLFKNLFCVAMSSKKIEACLWECMKRVTYNDFKITEETFEEEKAREDYIEVCLEVAKLNVAPFMKTLMQQYAPQLRALVSSLR